MNNKVFKLTALSTAVLLTLTACGSDNEPYVAPDAPPTAKNVTVSSANQWVPVTGRLLGSDANGDSISYSFMENGQSVTAQDGVFKFSHGYLTLSGDQFAYTSIAGEPVNIDYTATARGESASAQIQIVDVAQDPLANQQWHLRNVGQKAYSLGDEMKQALIDNPLTFFAQYQGTDEEILAQIEQDFADADKNNTIAGEDMNVVAAYAQGVTGKGVTAVVVDSGMEIMHEDLVDNVLPNRSLNLNVDAIVRTDPTNRSLEGDHGTSVAGLIAAKGWNGLGGRGVAPDTNLIGMNYLFETQEEVKVAQYDFIAHGFPGSGISPSENISAFNRSYGRSTPYFFSYSALDEQIESYPSLTLRDGKGALNIKSSGNSFVRNRSAGTMCADNGANELGLTCLNGAFEPSQGHPYYLSIAAVNANGKHTSYSTAGANLMVSAPAGEYGQWHPAMVTTDQMTCINGYSGFNGAVDIFSRLVNEDFAKALLPFNAPGHPDNQSCNYTSTFNGTSSAAPNASGVVSLILSANPSLTWRDVRHILAETSTLVDAENAKITLPIGEGEFVAHDGWVENAAGYNFNNLYGFGRVDAGKAVAMAMSYSLDLGQQIVSEWIGSGTTVSQASLDLAIPDNNATGTTYKIDYAEDLIIEGMQFNFDVSNAEMALGLQVEDENGELVSYQTSAGNDLAIEVTSPAGTRSVLLSSKQALLVPAVESGVGIHFGYILKNGVILSNAFYGENAKGTWTFKLVDTGDTNIEFTGKTNNIINVAGLINNKVDSVLEGVSLKAYGRAAQ